MLPSLALPDLSRGLPGGEADQAGLFIEEGCGCGDGDGRERDEHDEVQGQGKVGSEGRPGDSREEGVLEQINPVGKGIRIDHPFRGQSWITLADAVKRVIGVIAQSE